MHKYGQELPAEVEQKLDTYAEQREKGGRASPSHSEEFKPEVTN